MFILFIVNSSSDGKIAVNMAGFFVFVHATDIGLTVQYDLGMFMYLFLYVHVVLTLTLIIIISIPMIC